MDFERIRGIVQQDVGSRGLATDPVRNLFNACPADWEQASRSIAQTPQPNIAIVTGFYIPTAQPPAGETDGPLGALFLARALLPLGCRVTLGTDGFCAAALRAGLQAAGLDKRVPLVVLPDTQTAATLTDEQYAQGLDHAAGRTTHLIAIERVGPSHTLESLQRQYGGEALGQTYLDFLDAVPPDQQDRCHTMRGRDITAHMSPAHRLFELAERRGIVTIGIGDGGNEIGMGKIPWDVIQRNVPGGGLTACRTPTQHLLVCGISNWGAYALARGVYLARNQPFPPHLADTAQERTLLQTMVDAGPLVDGPSGVRAVRVDGLEFERYIAVLTALAAQ